MIGKVTNITGGTISLPDGNVLGIGESATMIFPDDLTYLLIHPSIPLPLMSKSDLESYQIGKGMADLINSGKLAFELLDLDPYLQLLPPLSLKGGDNISIVAGMDMQIASVVFEVTALPETYVTRLIISVSGREIVNMEVIPLPPPPPPITLPHAPKIIPPSLPIMIERLKVPSGPGFGIGIGEKFQVVLNEPGGMSTCTGIVTIGIVPEYL